MPKVNRTALQTGNERTAKVVDVQEPPPEELADDLRLEDGLPNPKALNVWDYMEALTPEQWTKHIWYIYRTRPKTVMGGSKPHYLDTGNEAFREQWIKENFGGGGYRLILNKMVGRTQPTLYDEYFTIAGSPKLRPEESLRDGGGEAAQTDKTGNEQLLSAKLLDDLIRQRDQAAESGKDFDTGQALQNALNLQNTGFNSALTAITANLGKQDNQSLTVLTTLVVELIRNNGKKDDSDLTKLLLEKALEKDGSDSIERLSAMLDFAEKLRGNPRGGSGRTDWASVGATFVQKLPEIFQNATEFIREAVIAKTALGPVIRPNPPAGQLAAAPAALEPGTPAAAPQPAAPSQQALYNRAVLVEGVKRSILKMAQESANEGAEEMTAAGEGAGNLAELMDAPFAHELARVLRTNPAALAGDAILSQCQTLPHIREFAAGYLKFFEDEPEPEQPAPAPPAAQPAAPTPA